jgi:hypothetical protein
MRACPKPTPRPKKARRPLRTGRQQLKRSRIKSKPPRRLLKPGAEAGQLYMGYVRTLPCVVAGMPRAGDCDGPPTASHIRSHTGMGLKPSDTSTVSMCAEHHLRHWEVRRGAFRGWTEEERQDWAAGLILKTQLRAYAMGYLAVSVGYSVVPPVAP